MTYLNVLIQKAHQIKNAQNTESKKTVRLCYVLFEIHLFDFSFPPFFLLFKEQTIFDEYNYQTWFRSNDLVENLCTYVPFMSCEASFDKEDFEAVDLGEMKSLEINNDDEQKTLKVPPMKKICSGIVNTLSVLFAAIYLFSRPEGLCSVVGKEAESKPATSKQQSGTRRLKKTYTCESILSLLVKIVYASKRAEWEEKNGNASSSNSSDKPFILEFDFAQASNLDREFYENRIGDESDFIVNVLEQAAQLDRKCSLIINKTVETLNASARKLVMSSFTAMYSTDMLMQAVSGGTDVASATALSGEPKSVLSKTSPSNEDDLK